VGDKDSNYGRNMKVIQSFGRDIPTALSSKAQTGYYYQNGYHRMFRLDLTGLGWLQIADILHFNIFSAPIKTGKFLLGNKIFHEDDNDLEANRAFSNNAVSCRDHV
jgi:hypothetical protein